MPFQDWINSIAEAGRELLQGRNDRQGKTLAQLCQELSSHKGEAMGTALACAVVSAYETMEDSQRQAFFELLINQYKTDAGAIVAAARAYEQNPDPRHFERLTAATFTPRQQLFSRINMAPNGTDTLIRLREHLEKYLKEKPEYKAIDQELKFLLENWFNRGFLTIRKIDWKTPAHILEKLIAYEAVHAMNGWQDLRRRLEDDRRCFAFFHPALEDEPLIFVEVALCHGLASAIQPLLAPRKPSHRKHAADTAIFYSISNCQRGLKGISFGNFLIKQVVMEIQHELPHIKRFATLSPIPGFNLWLRQEMVKEFSEVMSPDEQAEIISANQHDWQTRPELLEPLKELLLRLCAHYLCREKHHQQPLDAVARFHLGNGARIEQLNWMGDTSHKGMFQSCGLLVNYRYELKEVEANHESFVNEHTVHYSKAIEELLSKK